MLNVFVFYATEIKMQDNCFLLYKWTIYQPPAKKTFSHFKQSLKEKLEKWESLKPDLNISPVFFCNKKRFFIVFFDIEEIIFPNLAIQYWYTFTGKGLHIYLPIYTDYKSILKYRTEIIAMFKNTSVDIITSLRITPFRFFGGYSYKHNIWLHPYTKKLPIEKLKENSKKSPFELYTKDELYKSIVSYFENLKYQTIQKTLNVYKAVANEIR